MIQKDDPESIGNNHQHLYSVGEVCSLMHVTRKTLFYYDRIGLLKPTERTEVQQFKLYNKDQLNRLNQILIYRNAGLNIHEVRSILDDEKSDHLKVMENAMHRLEKERNEKSDQIDRLKALIVKEKADYDIHSLF